MFNPNLCKKNNFWLQNTSDDLNHFNIFPLGDPDNLTKSTFVITDRCHKENTILVLMGLQWAIKMCTNFNA